MKTNQWLMMPAAVLAAALFLPQRAGSHCDTMDGPLIKEAERALSSGEVTPVLKWLRPGDEPEIRDLFATTLKLRTLNDDARQMADRLFFETLTRVHRAGEGEPYTGLKPKGAAEPGALTADKALDAGNVELISAELTKMVDRTIRKRFSAALEKKKHADASTDAGRAFVAAYVEYVHFVEAVFKLAEEAPIGHHTKHKHEE